MRSTHRRVHHDTWNRGGPFVYYQTYGTVFFCYGGFQSYKYVSSAKIVIM